MYRLSNFIVTVNICFSPFLSIIAPPADPVDMSNATDKERMNFLADINLFVENGIRDELVKIGELLMGLDEDDELTPYLQLVRDEYEALANLSRFGSFDEMLEEYMDCRHRYVEVLAEIRKKHPDFNLYANRGQVPDTEKDKLDVLSFAVPGSVKSCQGDPDDFEIADLIELCQENPDVTDIADLMVRIICVHVNCSKIVSPNVS